MKQKIEIEVDVPDGMEIDGEPIILGGERTQGFYFSFKAVEPKKESRWTNVYREKEYESLSYANNGAGSHRVACIRIDYENNHPVSVALESVEGKG